MVDVHALALPGEDVRAHAAGVLDLAPELQGTADAGIERPCSRVVGFVLVERDFANIADVTPLELGSFAPAHAFAREKALEHAADERDIAMGEELRVFGRVKVEFPLL